MISRGERDLLRSLTSSDCGESFNGRVTPPVHVEEVFLNQGDLT